MKRIVYLVSIQPVELDDQSVPHAKAQAEVLEVSSFALQSTSLKTGAIEVRHGSSSVERLLLFSELCKKEALAQLSAPKPVNNGQLELEIFQATPMGTAIPFPLKG